MNGYIERDSDLVQGFVDASFRGWNYTLNHREEAIDILMKRFPELNRNEMIEELDLLIPLVFKENKGTVLFGYSDIDRWMEMARHLRDHGNIDRDVSLVEAISNTYISRSKSKWMKSGE